jgi:hypothetical protein
MVDSAKNDQEPKEGAQPIIEQPKTPRAYSALRRELTEDEGSHPVVHRLLLNDLDRLEQEVSVLTGLRDKYHESDRDKAVLEEKLKCKKTSELLQDASLGVGFLLLGLVPSLGLQQLILIVTVAGAILIITAIATKRGAR